MNNILVYKTIEIDGNIEDIVIVVNIINYVHVPPWRGNLYNCPSDVDATGFTTLDYEIVEAYRLTEFGERISIPLDVTQKLESEIYDELLTRAANCREEDLGDEPLIYMSY